jgi:hypothetical protein
MRGSARRCLPHETMAVFAEGDGPSTDSMPTAPSRPTAAVATVSPFAMLIISEMAPLSGKKTCSIWPPARDRTMS